MKFDKVIEGIEIVNKGLMTDYGAQKSFSIDGKGPYSIYDLKSSKNFIYNRLANILQQDKVRKVVSQNLQFLHYNDPKYMDISVKGGEVVITADNGREIVRLPI